MNNLTLETLVKPIELTAFFEKYWSKQYLHISSNDAGKYQHILTLQDFDQLITTGTHDTIRLVRERQIIPPPMFAQGQDKEAMVKFFNEGYTIVYEHLNKTWEPLRNLCWNVKNHLNIAKKVYANVYLTPASSQALKRHADWQDVFILQIHGEKRWQLFEAAYKLPINNEQTQNLAPTLENAPEVADLILKPGDLLYVPRGLAHEVHTQQKDSLHVTFTIETFSHYDVMNYLLRKCSNNHEYLRTNIPFDFFENVGGYTQQMFQELIKTNDFELSSDELNEPLFTSGNTNLKGYFVDQEKAKNLKNDTELILRKHLSIDFVKKGNAFIVVTNNYKFQVDEAAEEIAFIQQGNAFTLDALPGDLDKEEKEELVQMFIKTGILTFV